MNTGSKWTQKQRRIIAAAILVLLALGTVWVFRRLGRPMLQLAADPARFRDWVEARGIAGKIAYMGMVILQVLVALIPGEPLEIAAGYAFGAVEGTLLCLSAATLGSLLVFGLVRRFGVKLVELFFPREKLRSLRFLQSSGRRRVLFAIIFILPGTPKDLLCYFAGLTDIPFPTWLLLCSLGRLPSIISSTIGGDALGTESYVSAAIVFAVTLAVSGLGVLAYRQIQRRHAAKRRVQEDDS